MRFVSTTYAGNTCAGNRTFVSRSFRSLTEVVPPRIDDEKKIHGSRPQNK